MSDFSSQVTQWIDPSEVVKANITERLQQVFPPLDSFFLYPMLAVLTLVVGSFLVLLLGAWSKHHLTPKPILNIFALIMTVIAAGFSFMIKPAGKVFLASGFIVDGITFVGFVTISLGLLATLVLTLASQKGRESLMRYEGICLVMMAAIGMMVTVASGDFASFFIGLELTSLSLYILISKNSNHRSSLEASLKYFFMGAAASATILMGVALLYSQLGSLRFEDLQYLTLSSDRPIVLIGLTMFLCGLAFKLGLAPFHMWSPDVYQSAQTQLTGMMASLVKVTITLVLVRIIGSWTNTNGMLPELSHLASLLFLGFGLLSVGLGSVFGIVNFSVKRMLGYSSIANAGAIALGLGCLARHPNNLALSQNLLGFLTLYAFMAILSFAVISWIEDGYEHELFRSDLKGLGQIEPRLATWLTIVLLALGGLPPFIGFMGKFLILRSLFSENLPLWIPILFIGFSVFSMIYYLTLVIQMWFENKTTEAKPTSSLAKGSAHGIGSFLILIMVLMSIAGPFWIYKLDLTLGHEGSKKIVNQTSAPVLDEVKE